MALGQSRDFHGTDGLSMKDLIKYKYIRWINKVLMIELQQTVPQNHVQITWAENDIFISSLVYVQNHIPIPS